MADTEYAQCMEIVEAVMEYIAMRWSNSMIKRQLREWLPGLSGISASFIISAARKEIRRRYHIDPSEYKGKQIAFYEHVIRCKSKMRDKLTAAERLDKLYGLETLSSESPEETARKIREELIQLEDQIEGVPDDVRDRTKRESEAHSGVDGGQQRETTETTEATEETKERIDTDDVQDVASFDDIPKEVLENINGLKPDEIKGFRKEQDRKRESVD